MATIILVRHGQSRWNAEHRFQGQGGVGLSDAGRAQAAASARFVAGRYPRVAALVASDLERVLESAAPLEEAYGLPAKLDARWREVDVGTWTGLAADEIAARDADGLAAWRRHEDAANGGEPFAAVRARVAAALDDAWDLAGDGTVVVVTSGGPVRFAVAAALGLATESLLAPVGNAAVTVLERRPGPRLVLYGATAHLG